MVLAIDAADRVLRRFVRRAATLSRVRDSSQMAYDHGHLKQADLDHVFESTFLTAVSSFEEFFEELFISAVLGASGIDRVQPRTQFPNVAVAWDVLLANSNRGYLEWLSFEQLLARADAFLLGGRPFSRLRNRPSEARVIADAVKIRNAIAHEGGTAQARFRSLDIRHLPTHRRHPAGYLQSRVGGSRLTQHQTRLADIERVARALAALSSARAETFLNQERNYSSGERPGRGAFRCRRCGNLSRITSVSGRLPDCPSCHPGPCLTCNHSTKSMFVRA